MAFEDHGAPASAISRTCPDPHQGKFPELSFTSVSAVIEGPACGLKNKRAHIWESEIDGGERKSRPLHAF